MSPTRAYSIKIFAHTPLSLGDESKLGNFEQTLNFIPGAILRGAVAARTLKDCPLPDHQVDHSTCPQKDTCPFWQIFGKEEVHFGYSYPGKLGPVYPFPLTAHTCKYNPGLPNPESLLVDGHGIYDLLAGRFIYELLADPEFPARDVLLPAVGRTRLPLVDAPAEKCPRCQADLAPASGFYVPGSPLVAGSEPHTRRTAHVSINRARGVAEEGLLFTQETLDARAAGALFFGLVRAPDHLAATLEPFLQGEYYLGRGRSRGLGQVTLEPGLPYDEPDLPTRFQAFQDGLRVALRRWRPALPNLPSRLPGNLASLTLISPASFETAGRPALVPDPVEIGLPGAVLLRAWTRPTVLSGWDQAARLPRRTRLAAAAGSVYLFHLPGEAGDYLPALQALEDEGLGGERSRGLGQVQVCARIHSAHSFIL